MNPNPVSLPEDYGFTHSIRGEDPGAVAKQYTAAQTLTGLTQVVRSVYFNGHSAQLQTMGQEFEFQLDGQYSVLAQIPADKYVQAREVFKHQGRQGAAATQRARTKLENRLTDYRVDLEDKPSEAEARRWAREVMKQVEAPQVLFRFF
ncbi:Uncharacterised protein [Actinomyces bovis]|uniref:Uncharacterized protein n=1 Tax=Actinomyces bovis TaxID=1658 RepID=A0ABY1VN40_9ACTO|nr:polymorphic toxin type 15 domain-containing protein [Actinomyces bovis]SPT53534.1 Uncharacterised protein [Actinomyces bovis]VEG55489.1 Uncharacterised protein [Actinomyces israelii]